MGQLVLLRMPRRAGPGFRTSRHLLADAHFDRSWLAAVAVILQQPIAAESETRHRKQIVQYLPRYLPLRELCFSCLLHASVLSGLVFVPFWAYFDNREAAQPSHTAYRLERIDLSAYLPQLRAKGLGGKPGRGRNPENPPSRGSTSYHPRITVASNPRLPDNNRQTILQSNSPPDLRIPFELRLPNIIAGAVHLPSPKPPQRLIPLAPMVPLGATKTETRAITPPAVSERVPEFALELPAAQTLPKLAVPRAVQIKALRASEGKPAASRIPEGGESAPELGGLLAISVDPGPAAELLSLPPGNRLGQFSISPGGVGPGSPGGVEGGNAKGGASAGNGAGNGASGVGAGSIGGGGPAGVGDGTISISGNGNETSATLEGSIDTAAIFPVMTHFRPRKNALTVSTGPTGGGGLRVYGVLAGGRIYTVYFPMRDRNWVMQYCLREASAKVASSSPHVVAKMDYGVIPPDATERFDFHRPAVPAEKRNAMIILHGILGEEGIPQQVKILQGVQADADGLALATFKKWKFKTALRDGKPVAVEFLVGIPVTANGSDAGPTMN